MPETRKQNGRMKGLIQVIKRAKLIGVILLTAMATVALGLPRVSGTAATVPAAAQPWPAQLARPVPASCPRGQTLIAPTGGWTDALGVSHVTYKARPGLVAVVPPRGLTAGRVTAALMADVGLRARHSASSPSHQLLVRKVLNLARGQRAPEFCRSGPDLGVLHRTPAGSPLLNTVIFHSIWGGYATTQKEHGSPLNGAAGSWRVPGHTAGLSPSAESTWVGIGGNIGGETGGIGLIQTGTSMQTGEGFRSWWEYLGTSGCVNTFCGQYSSINAISPGDSVFGEVTWNTSTSACFFFADFTRSTGSFDVCQLVNIPYDHTSAEWVNENHIPNGLYYDNPHTVSWSGMLINNTLAAGGAWVSPFSTPYEAVLMGPGSTPGAGTVSCASGNFLSYPVSAATNSGGGTSKILTCYIPGIDSP
jgi:Peptidase A4 family